MQIRRGDGNVIAGSLRPWATPLTIGSFSLIATTGVLMFFELDQDAVRVAHKWLSWAFLIGVLAHILVNLRPLSRHLASLNGRVSIVVFSAMLVLAVVPRGAGPSREALARGVEQRLSKAPLVTIAALAGTDANGVQVNLRSQGIEASPQDNVLSLAARSRASPRKILAIIFGIDD